MDRLVPNDPLALAGLLGRMHARTFGRQPEYDQLHAVLGPRTQTEYYTYEWLTKAFAESATLLEIAPPADAATDLRRVIAAIRDPGPFLAYIHGDPCPDNVLQT